MDYLTGSSNDRDASNGWFRKFIDEDSVGRGCLQSLWTALGGWRNQCIDTYNLCKVICSIMGSITTRLSRRRWKLRTNLFLRDHVILSLNRIVILQGPSQPYWNRESCTLLKGFQWAQTIILSPLHQQAQQGFFERGCNLVAPFQTHHLLGIEGASREKRTKILEEAVEMLKSNEIE